jgi:transposase
VKNSPIFIFGDATYDSAGSVTESFAQFVIDKLKSLGYRVYRVSEYFTSQVCPCCNNKVDNLSMRIKYCNHCKMHYHRDVMAGENMAMAGLSIAMTGDRPAYLKTNYTEARSRKPPDRNPGPSSSRQ